jgi:hypothetical protein
MTEQPTSTGPKCPKCFHPQGAPDGDHYTTCPDYRHPSGEIAGGLAEFYASPEYRAEVLLGRAPERASEPEADRANPDGSTTTRSVPGWLATWEAAERATPATPGPCQCWSCDGQCGGTALSTSCGPLAVVDGRPICAVCRGQADVFGNDLVGAQVTIDQDRVRLALRWAGPLDSVWLDARSARHLAAVLIQRASELEQASPAEYPPADAYRRGPGYRGC